MRTAVQWLRAHGVDARLVGRGTVGNQQPAPGAPLPSRVLLKSGS
jgi:hypothetical protein